MTAIPLDRSLDLSCHAVVEASAGTGKTYTIERLVARILRDVPEVTLDHILLLTYTEKATGELRDRIRGHLEDSLGKSDGEVARRLREAVEGFDAAQIFTIHGFCQRVLQEYAFENGQLFDLELSGDDTVIRRLFREQLRTVWARDYLASLPPELARELADKGFLEEDILWLSRALQPDDLLLPEPPPAVEDLLPEYARVARELRQRMGAGFLTGYWQLNLKKTDDFKGLTKNSIEPIWTGLCDLLAMESDTQALEQAAAWYRSIGYSRFRDGDNEEWQGFRVLVPPVLRLPRGQIQAPPECPQLPAVMAWLAEEVEPLLRRAQLLFADRPVAIMRASVQALRERYAAFKQEQGLLDFDDMLQRVRQALMQSESLLAALRAKYRFALVDEFQDTDPIQWDIFRRIFVETDGGPQRLFLIGDPKQAIYGFRGADVNTYLEARDTLLRGFGPRVLYSLATNYRSIPHLLRGLNQAFLQGGWFPPASAGARIAYEPVDWPKDEFRPVRVARDGTRRSPLCLVHVDKPGLPDAKLTVAQARWRMARFIGEEIERLLAAPDQFQFLDPETKQVRGLQPGDCCILVQRRATAKPIEQRLRELGIPYTFYKQPGIYQSAEALHTSLVLGALAEPDATRALHPALLSRFFGYLPHELVADPAGVEHATREPFERWRELCRLRRWPELFRRLLEDTGLACREALQPDGERRLANYRQLFLELVSLAEEQTLDIAGLREQLDLRRWRSVAVEGDEDLHHIDTERPKVVLMTMHASKGLQFPIVFLADGFSALGRVSSSTVRYHWQGNRVVDLDPGGNPLGKRLAEQESIDETRRLYYVALTRSRFKVYIPFGWNPGEKPLTPLLTPAFDGFWNRGDDPQNDDVACHLNCLGGIEGNGYPMPPIDDVEDWELSRTESPASVDELGTVVDSLRAPPPLGRWRRQVDSYSSLAQDHGPANQTEFGEVSNEAAADDWTTPRGEDTLLPPGASAGTALHEILEAADFAAVRAATGPRQLLATDFASLVDRAMARNGLVNLVRDGDRSTRLELATLAWKALHTPLAADGFCLGDLAPEDRQTELEFHLSEGEEFLGWSAAVPPGRRGLLNGFVDLVFRHNGRYSIVDWKSNALPGYAGAEVLASMEEHEYTLQFRIYALALAAWLERCLPDFSPERHLGSVYYLYVRGLNGTDTSSGVFHQPLDAACLAAYRQEVLDRLAAY